MILYIILLLLDQFGSFQYFVNLLKESTLN